MPIIKSAKKALRQSIKRRKTNQVWKIEMHKAVKSVEKFAAAKKNDEFSKALRAAYKIVDKSAKRRMIKKNKAARVKSRLSRLVGKTA
ncbi:30S ribosomal protein S20 [Candidatus Giovannonibacteria bacterium]|nr:30S ribosomal protein S20 [Candidatus Giovannonibacteria bacterium]